MAAVSPEPLRSPLPRIQLRDWRSPALRSPGQRSWSWSTIGAGAVCGIVAYPKFHREVAPKSLKSSSLFAKLKKTVTENDESTPSVPGLPPAVRLGNERDESEKWRRWLHSTAQRAAEKGRMARERASILLSKLRKASKRHHLKPRKLIQSVWWSLKDSWCRIKPRQRILSVVLAFLLLITLWPSQHVTQAPKIQDQSIAQLSPGEESRLQMLSQTTPGVVYVKGKPAPWISEKENQGEFVPGGSAWIFDNRHVVTSLKNIENARRGSLKVVLEDRTELPARIIGVDTGSDLAVLELPKTAIRQSLPVLPLGASASLRLGQDVILVGREATLDMRISKGVIYGLGQPLEVVDGDLPVQSCIQTDVLMNPRNRGGPLLNSRGQVIGMAVGQAENQVGQAIPSDSLQKHVQSIISNGHVTRPSLGMYLAPDGFAEKLGVNGGGVVVQEVLPGSPAKKAGLRKGDIIISQGDHPIHRMDDLITVLEPFSPGDHFSLTVLRQTAGQGTFAPFSSQTYSQVDLIVRAETDA